jgi:hypothetical protein
MRDLDSGLVMFDRSRTDPVLTSWLIFREDMGPARIAEDARTSL